MNYPPNQFSHLFVPMPIGNPKTSSFGQQTMTGNYAQNVENNGKMFFGGRPDDEYDEETEEKATITLPMLEFKKLKKGYKSWDRLSVNYKLQEFLNNSDPETITFNSSLASK